MQTRRITALLMAMLLIVTLMFSSCEKTTIDYSCGDKKTDFSEVSLPGIELNDPTGSGNTIAQELLPADAVLSGGARLSGDKITGMNQQGDSITYNVTVPVGGYFDLTFEQTGDGNRVNYVAVDGYKIAEITPDTPTAKFVCMTEGDHTITLTPSWGYVDFGKVTLSPTTVDFRGIYNVSAGLSNPNSDEHTRMLYKFLCDIFGQYSLAGQFAEKGRESDEYKAVLDATGDSFAVLGLDVGNYTHSAVANNASSMTVEYAHDWYYNAGGIVQICWHWLSPLAYVEDGKMWWDSFRPESSKIDLDAVMNGEDDRCLEKLDDDIDDVAEQLLRLQEDGVPVIFRPLHEASGGWFWWGDCEPDSYIKLYRHLYDRLVNEYHLNNLIWMWNGQSEDWYPGDDVVDIVAWDIYPGEREYGSYSSTFARCAECSGERKLVALSENGCVMDPELTWRDNARWLFWGTWSGEYCVENGVLSEKFTDKEMLKKAYSDEHTLTLSKLPNLRKYPLD